MSTTVKKTPPAEAGRRVEKMENLVLKPYDKGTDIQRDMQENEQVSLQELDWSFSDACRRAKEIEAINTAYSEENSEMLNRLQQPFRIGDDLWEIVYSPRHDGSVESTLVRRTRQSVKERFPERGFIEATPYFHSAVNVPDNLTYRHVIKGCFNLYPAPIHQVSVEAIKELNAHPERIATWIILMRHIFGKQLRLGIEYVAVAVQHPEWIVPILCLVSPENGTGKTSFARALGYLFGSSVCMCGMADLVSTFNFYLKYLFTVFEEISNAKGSRDKLKAAATATRVTLNEKFVAQRSIDVNPHIVINSNDADDFISANKYDIRYWVRRLKPLDKWIPDFDERLKDEAGLFFNFLATVQLPSSKSRMFFSPEDIYTAQLDVIRQNSLSACAQDLRIFIGEKVSEIGQFYATITELNEQTCLRKYSSTQVSKALREELGYKACKQMRYINLAGLPKNGQPYLFEGEGEDDLNVVPPDEDIPF